MNGAAEVSPGDVLWTPTAARIEHSRLDRFRRFVEEQYAVTLDDSVALHQWSLESPNEFWSAVWQWCEIAGDPGPRASAK